MALPAALSCHSPCSSFRSSVLCQMREKKQKINLSTAATTKDKTLWMTLVSALAGLYRPPLLVRASKGKGSAYRAGELGYITESD